MERRPTPTSRSPSASRPAATNLRPSCSPRPRRATRPTWCRPSTRCCRLRRGRRARRHQGRSVRDQGRLQRRDLGPVTLGTDAVYGVPAGQRPDDALLPHRPVHPIRPHRPQDLGRVRRRGSHGARQGQERLPRQLLQQGPGLVRRAVPAGRRHSGGRSTATPGRSASTTPPRRRSPTTGAAWSTRASSTRRPMYTPEWNTALNDGTLLAGPRPSGHRVCSPATPPTARASGRWRRCRSGARARSSPASGAARRPRSRPAPSTRRPPREFAAWLNTDPKALRPAGQGSGDLPGRQEGAGAAHPARRPSSPTSPTSGSRPTTIASTARGFTFGPNVNVAYSAYKDAFDKAVQNKSSFTDALTTMQETTVADMKKTGFKLSS